MRWTHSELINTKSEVITIDEDIVVDDAEFAGNSRINSVRDVHVSGTGSFNIERDLFYVTMRISGTMLVPDAITAEEIEYDFETEAEETYSFSAQDEEVRMAVNDVIDLMPAAVDAILLEVPLQVTHADPEDYPSGDGWRIITEEEYQKSQQDRIDPRLAKLKEFKTEK
ncbi:MAG: DUF177 domain-containing protein [Solobacterium sp.]|nr:DUF177 domain-containing protein [Solobacterium sp.]MBR2670084.1 DUF177 domain-containing protein [Solobacterium sp.]